MTVKSMIYSNKDYSVFGNLCKTTDGDNAQFCIVRGRQPSAAAAGCPSWPAAGAAAPTAPGRQWPVDILKRTTSGGRSAGQQRRRAPGQSAPARHRPPPAALPASQGQGAARARRWPLCSWNFSAGAWQLCPMRRPALPATLALLAAAGANPAAPPPPLPKPTGPVFWAAGSNLLRVSAFPTASKALLYELKVNGSTWFSSADVMLRCGGTDLSSSDSLLAAAPTVVKGTDPHLGAFDSVSQRWSPMGGATLAGCDGVSAIASTYYYPSRDLFEFRLVLPSGATGTATGQNPERFLFETLTDHSTAFPQLALSPTAAKLGFLSWSGNSLGSKAGPRDYASRVPPYHGKDGYAMAEHSFPDDGGLSDYRGGLTAGPLVLYGLAPVGLPEVVVIAPLDDYKNVIVAQPRPGLVVLCGAQGFLDPLPKEFTTRVGVLGRRGIQAAVYSWGEAAKAVANTRKTSLENDTLSRQLHYLTDNGAVYAESVSCPLPYGPRLAMLASQPSLQHVGLWHLDPFWYSTCPGSPGCAAGTFGRACDSSIFSANFTPSRWHFPSGVIPVGFAQHFQMFISALAPRAYSDYTARYQIIDAAPWFTAASGSSRAMPAASASASFWTDVITHHAKLNGLRAVVWDDTISLSFIFDENLNSTTKTTQMLSGLFTALETVGATARVDMQGPTDAMLGLRFPALTVGRAAGDGTPSSNDITPQVDLKTGEQNGGWRLMSGNGLLFAALDIRPMLDVLWTTPMQPYVGHVNGTTATRSNLEHGLAMTVLSTGPLGIGDAIGRTNLSFLVPALRSDGVILKPCRPALRLDRFYAGTSASRQQEIWMAVSAPARAVQTERDGRAESMARLGTGISSSWWLNLISTNLALGTPGTHVGDLWPMPPQDSSFLVHTYGTLCANGTNASSCTTLFDASHPLAATTGAMPSATDPIRRWRLQSASPVLPSGWALLGDLSRIVPVSPQRFVSAYHAAESLLAEDDSMDASELAAPGGGLAFDVIGAVGEEVEVTLAQPPVQTILNVAIVIPATGRVTVTCSAGGACAQR